MGAGGLGVCVVCAWGTVTLRAVPGAGNPPLHRGEGRAELALRFPFGVLEMKTALERTSFHSYAFVARKGYNVIPRIQGFKPFVFSVRETMRS